MIDKMDKAKIDGEANNLVTFINNEYAKEKAPIDKDWIEMVIDKFYHPEKYAVESKRTNLELLPMFDYYMEMPPLSEVRKKYPKNPFWVGAAVINRASSHLFNAPTIIKCEISVKLSTF